MYEKAHPMVEGNFVLEDKADLPSNGTPVRRVNGSISFPEAGGMDISFEGYGDHDSRMGEGTSIHLELYDGRLRAAISDDINDADLTVVDLEGGRESARELEGSAGGLLADFKVVVVRKYSHKQVPGVDRIVYGYTIVQANSMDDAQILVLRKINGHQGVAAIGPGDPSFIWSEFVNLSNWDYVEGSFAVETGVEFSQLVWESDMQVQIHGIQWPTDVANGLALARTRVQDTVAIPRSTSANILRHQISEKLRVKHGVRPLKFEFALE